MQTIFIAIGIFLFGYLLNIFYITVLYHRALTHKAIVLGPKMHRWLYYTGVWVTGLDPKSWACMHRLHHLHSDEANDPHSPNPNGIMAVWVSQYKSYLSIMNKMITEEDASLNQLMSDVPFMVTLINRKGLSNLPYFVHTTIALILFFLFDSSLIGFSYFVGIMSHPVQGWMVNALAHRYGFRNYETSDNSRNNLLVAYFVFGEGLQNNHHAHPERAKFSIKAPEVDLGYGLCVIGAKLGFYQMASSSECLKK